MDNSTFDRLTRQLAATSTRRSGLGLALAGAALFGLLVTDEVDARGKGKGKNKKKKKKKTNQQAACSASSVDCGGGVCVAAGECCPGEKTCGGGCIRAQDCCPYTERNCPNGVCVPKDACCPIVETRCGAECCGLGEECCNGACGFSGGGVCTNDGWCPVVTGVACCTGSVTDCANHPCCNVDAGEGCCFTRLEPFVETTCCPGGPGQCALGGCCPTGTVWKGDCNACCTNASTGCSSCRAPVPGRG